MNQPGPRNGYTWSPREMMQRRDAARWQMAHLYVTFAPLPALLFFPVGTIVGLFGFTLAWLVQAYQTRSPFADSAHEFSRPILIQRVFAFLTVIMSFAGIGFFGPSAVLGAIGGVLWFRLLGVVEKRTRFEREVEKADRDALTIEAPLIRE